MEDETGVRELASEFLKGSGYAVLGARDGVEALEMSMLHDGAIHLLASDLIMLGMGGEGLAGKRRKLRSDLGVCYMTGYAQHAEDKDHLPSSSSEILQKPFMRPSLLEKVREALAVAPREQVVGGNNSRLISLP